MATAGWSIGASREMLSRTIVESLKSWPEFQRRIFVETHYRGRTVEEVAKSLGLPQDEVLAILEHCERSLHHALRSFRDADGREMAPEPPHPVIRQACACLP